MVRSARYGIAYGCAACIRAIMLAIGASCFSHSACASGHCSAGTCQPPRRYTPCSTAYQNCPPGYRCNSTTNHCLANDSEFSPDNCRSSANCAWGEYCEQSKKTCKPRLGHGEACAVHSICGWDLACVNGHCVSKCLVDDHCPSGEVCVKLSGPDNIKYCKSQSKSKPVPPAPSAPKPVTPASPVPKVNPSASSNQSGVMGYISEHRMAFIISGVTLLVLVLLLLAFLIGRKGRSKRHSVRFPDPLIATTPVANQSYNENEVASASPYYAPPPSYEEASSPTHGDKHEKP